MWREKSISIATKMKLYNALVVPALAVRLRMLESEERGRAKAVSGRDELVEEHHIGRSRREKVRNEQTREELGAEETVVQKIKKRRLQWFGHVERMEGKNYQMQLCPDM